MLNYETILDLIRTSTILNAANVRITVNSHEYLLSIGETELTQSLSALTQAQKDQLFISSIESNNLACAQIFLEQGANVHANNDAAFFFVVQSNNNSAASLNLLFNYAAGPAQYSLDQLCEGFRLAAQNNLTSPLSFALLRVLYKQTRKGAIGLVVVRDALTQVQKNDLLLAAVERNDELGTRWLCNLGAQVGYKNNQALRIILDRGQAYKVAAVLLEYGANPDQPAPGIFLRKVLSSGTLVRLLLHYGADFRMNSNAIMHRAIRANFQNAVVEFLRKGAYSPVDLRSFMATALDFHPEAASQDQGPKVKRARLEPVKKVRRLPGMRLLSLLLSYNAPLELEMIQDLGIKTLGKILAVAAEAKSSANLVKVLLDGGFSFEQSDLNKAFELGLYRASGICLKTLELLLNVGADASIADWRILPCLNLIEESANPMRTLLLQRYGNQISLGYRQAFLLKGICGANPALTAAAIQAGVSVLALDKTPVYAVIRKVCEEYLTSNTLSNFILVLSQLAALEGGWPLEINLALTQFHIVSSAGEARIKLAGAIYNQLSQPFKIEMHSLERDRRLQEMLVFKACCERNTALPLLATELWAQIASFIPGLIDSATAIPCARYHQTDLWDTMQAACASDAIEPISEVLPGGALNPIFKAPRLNLFGHSWHPYQAFHQLAVLYVADLKFGVVLQHGLDNTAAKVFLLNDRTALGTLYRTLSKIELCLQAGHKVLLKVGLMRSALLSMQEECVAQAAAAETSGSVNLYNAAQAYLKGIQGSLSCLAVLPQDLEGNFTYEY